jgi:hypothetical protein
LGSAREQFRDEPEEKSEGNGRRPDQGERDRIPAGLIRFGSGPHPLGKAEPDVERRHQTEEIEQVGIYGGKAKDGEPREEPHPEAPAREGNLCQEEDQGEEEETEACGLTSQEDGEALGEKGEDHPRGRGGQPADAEAPGQKGHRDPGGRKREEDEGVIGERATHWTEQEKDWGERKEVCPDGLGHSRDDKLIRIAEPRSPSEHRLAEEPEKIVELKVIPLGPPDQFVAGGRVVSVRHGGREVQGERPGEEETETEVAEEEKEKESSSRLRILSLCPLRSETVVKIDDLRGQD